MARDAIERDMKFFVSFIVILFATGACSAQQDHSDFSKQIHIPSGYLRLDTIASLISRQSSLRLSINTRKFPPSKMIRLQKGLRPIFSILADIQKSIGNGYKILGDHVIFIEKPPVPGKMTKHFTNRNDQIANPSPAPKKTLKGPINKLKADPPPTRFTPISNTPVSIRKIMPVSDKWFGIRLPDYPDSVNARKEVPRLKPFSGSPSSGAPSKAHNRRERPYNKGNVLPILLEAGLNANELLYVNPTLRIGVPVFYGIASWGSNFERSEFQWGAGTSFSIDDTWGLKIEATTGMLKRSSDSSQFKVSAGERLYRVGLSGEKQLSRRLKFEVGLGLNVLNTRYFPSESITSMPPEGVKYLFNQLGLLKPPYTIIDHSTSSPGKNNKFWIGVQVGLFYDLNFFKRHKGL